MIAVLFFCSVGGVFLLAHDATGTNITLLIIIHAQLINARAFVRRGMSELTVSDVDADMRHAIAAAGVKRPDRQDEDRSCSPSRQLRTGK